MNQMLSVVIPMGGEDAKGRRLRNLTETLGCIHRQTFTDYEVIIVEEVFNGNIIFEDMNVDQYIQVEGDKNGNRSWTRNIGANVASGDRLLQMDGDILFETDYFQRIIDDKRPWFVAWDTCFRLTKKGAEEFTLDEDINKLFHNRDYAYGAIHPTDVGCAGFCNYFSRDFYFNKLGGYNENFFGWGGEDNDIALRARKIVGRLQDFSYTIYHQPHEAREGGNNEFEKTKANPMVVTERLKKAKLGRLENPTLI